MAEGGEMRGFVFSLIFIVVFATLLSSIPAGLQGTGESPDTVIPIDPSLVTGFSESETYTRDNFTGLEYEYSLNSLSWVALYIDGVLSLAAKVLTLGFWLGHLNPCKFVSAGKTPIDRGTELALTDITTDAEDGAIRYALQFVLSGDSAGSLVAYWNTTTYDNATQAWNNDELYLLHGVGFDTSATTNIGALIVSLLLFQLPDVPVLVNMFLAVPIWACIVYVLWYVIKEMIPFLG